MDGNLEPVPEQHVDEQEQVGSDNEGEDLDENFSRDYREMSGLDAYEEEGIDEGEQEEELSYSAQMRARRAAEEEIERRARRGAPGGLPGALQGDSEDDEEGPEYHRAYKRRQVEAAQAGDMDDDQGRVPVDLANCKGKIREHLKDEAVCAEVKVRFRRMLARYTADTGELLYRQRLRDLARENKGSLFMDFTHLAAFDETMAVWAADAPAVMLKIFSEAASETLLEMYPEYQHIHADSIHVRFLNIPLLDSIRDLREQSLETMVRTTGVVTRRTGVFPQLQLVKYDCLKCGHTTTPFAQNDGGSEQRPQQCPACQSKGPFQINSAETVYRNYQKLTVQESPGSVPAGRLPRHKDVILLHDLIDVARPGDEVEIIGMYTHGYDVGLNLRNGFPVFTTYIVANSVTKRSDKFAAAALTEDDVAAVEQLSEQPDISARIFRSVAPSIYGHTTIKKALSLALFGGIEKHPSNAHRLRGDINILMLGDPGTAKSQFLKYLEKTAARAVYTTGKGASAVGLTASVHKDSVTREWTLEGGALVLADSGVCLIDEFDKMNDQDRVSIHEAMEQQSISISKAGIVAQLQARCSVVAAANPVGGRYNSTLSFSENVELSDPIISRFDVLCVVRDLVDPAVDQRLAEFVVGNHMVSHPDTDIDAAPSSSQQAGGSGGGVIEQELLRKYITYARQNCHPMWPQELHDKIAEVYADLRGKAQRAHGMPIAVRHLESMVRLSEAHARLHLRPTIAPADVDVAVGLMVETFISTQKFSVHRELRRQFRKYLTSPSDLFPLLLQQLHVLLREELHARQAAQHANPATETFRIPCFALEERAREAGVTEMAAFYESPLFKDAGFQLDTAQSVIVHG